MGGKQIQVTSKKELVGRSNQETPKNLETLIM